MEKEVFDGHSREEFVEVIRRLRAEGRDEEAAKVEALLALWDLRSGRLDARGQRVQR